jgi:hypothetical protein
MSKNVKCLITGGCSFSQPNNSDINWVHHLEDYISPEYTVHQGLGAAGNGMISRRVISAVDQCLKTYQPNEILVGVMWSQFSRRDFYSVKKLDCYLISGSHYHYANPASGYIKDQSNWYLMHEGWTDPLTTRFVENFYNLEDSLINCFEHILRTQWYLESKKIPYFFTEFDYSAFDDFPFRRRWLSNPELNFLYNQIDKTKWLPIENCYQWCRYESGKEFAREGDGHPSTEQHLELTKRIIIPFLINNGLLNDTAN